MIRHQNIVTTTFLISNLHCPSCITSIQSLLEVLTPAPISISHSIISHSITIHHDDDLPATTITTALEHAGFEVYSVVVHGEAGAQWTLEEEQTPPSPRGDWGLEQAVHRWTQARKSANVDESRKRNRHMAQCKHCQEEEAASTRMSSESQSESLIGKEDVTRAFEKHMEEAPRPSTCETAPPVVVIDGQTPRVFVALFSVSGMTCSACVANVTKVVSSNAWVRSVDVALLTNSATVTFQGVGRESQIRECVGDAGYDVALQSIEELSESPNNATGAPGDSWRASYAVGGMTCSACVGAITHALKQVVWIEHVEVNLLSNSATVTFRGQTHASEIQEMVEDLGYDASLQEVVKLEEESLISSERHVAIRIEGMYCHHCPSRILSVLSETYGASITISDSFSEKQPLLHLTYKPLQPTLTMRHIVNTIKATDPSFHPSIYHPPTIEERSQQIHTKERRRILLRLALSVIVAVPTFIIGIVYMSLVSSSNPVRRYLMSPAWAGHVSRAEWALFIMSSVIYFFAADIFHIRTIAGVRALWRRGSPVPLLERFYRFGSMNMLITIGTSIAYFASIAALAIEATKSSSVQRGDATSYYFDSVVFLTMFLLLGRFLEAYSKARTGDAVASLGLLRPSEALLVASETTSAQVDEKVSVDLLEVEDVVRVLHGSSPPFDGVIVHGEARFDESSLTGESRLVAKSTGDQVFSGTVNKGNPITIRLTSISGTSMLDQIIKVVREGQTPRAPIERVADVITSSFVPFIVLIGILTWIVWLALGLSGALPDDYLDTSTGGWPFWSLQFSIAVFVIACPCGIGLAAPTALFVGGGIAAKNGILVKGGGEAFQEASMLDCIVFDKTGTLTQGSEPVVTEHIITQDSDANAVMRIARALEENSGHPIAASIASFCALHGAEVCKTHDIEEIAGKGLMGRIELSEATSANAIIGNEALMADYSVSMDALTISTINAWKTAGKSIALMATGTTTASATPLYTLAAAFAISDPIRPEAAEVIQTLRQSGLSIWLLSGDNQVTAETVGASVGIPKSNVIAGVLPEQKAEKIKYLQRTLPGHHGKSSWFWQRVKNSRATVAMVGDGINDAPALATADVGIAVGSGSDVALSTASFVLLTSDLRTLVTLTTLSRAVFRRVWFNFGWALVYNMVALPIAAGVLYPVVSGGSHVRLDAVWASLAMALSSVSVVMSSLALRTRIPGVGFRTGRPIGAVV